MGLNWYYTFLETLLSHLGPQFNCYEVEVCQYDWSLYEPSSFILCIWKQSLEKDSEVALDKGLRCVEEEKEAQSWIFQFFPSESTLAHHLHHSLCCPFSRRKLPFLLPIKPNNFGLSLALDSCFKNKCPYFKRGGL